jgi:hypothetical protein
MKSPFGLAPSQNKDAAALDPERGGASILKIF